MSASNVAVQLWASYHSLCAIDSTAPRWRWWENELIDIGSIWRRPILGDWLIVLPNWLIHELTGWSGAPRLPGVVGTFRHAVEPFTINKAKQWFMIHDSFEAFCISKYNYITVRPKARWAGLIYRTHQLPPPVTIKHRVVKFREISRTMDEKNFEKRRVLFASESLYSTTIRKNRTEALFGPIGGK